MKRSTRSKKKESGETDKENISSTAVEPKRRAKKDKILQESNANEAEDRKVKFGASKVHKFDKKDAPACNIYDVASTQDEDAPPTFIGRIDGIVIPPTSPRKPKEIFSLSFLNVKTEENKDTKDLTVSELNAELSRRGLSIAGTKEEKKARLDRALVKEGFKPSPEKFQLKEDKWLKFDVDDTPVSFFTPTPSASKQPIKTYAKRTARK